MNKTKIFVSYSSKDKEYLDDLADFRKSGIVLVVDKKFLYTGDHIAERLKQEIENCDACLFIQTKDSLRSSWCIAELAAFWAASKPIIILIRGDKKSTVKPIPFLAGVKTATLLKEVKDKILSLPAHKETTQEPNFGEIGFNKGIAAITDVLNTVIAPVKNEISGLHDRITTLTPFDENSLFGLRFRHFYDEKRAIADIFVRELEKTITEMNDNQKNRGKIRLLLDSGTTIFPIFSMLMNRKKNRLLTESIEIVTNNVSGLAIIMKYGQRDDGDPHSRPAYKVLSVSGEPLTAFWAILPDKPGEVLGRALNRTDKQSGKRPITIAVTTSNYLKSDGKSLFVRIPKHLEFKKTIMDIADRIYILFPLGKMLDATVKDMNDKLVSARNKKNDDRLYRELQIPFNKGRCITFITTKRFPGDHLYSHFVSVEDNLTKLKKKREGKSGCNIETIFLNDNEFSMANLCNKELAREEELEMPHKDHRQYLRSWLKWS